MTSPFSSYIAEDEYTRRKSQQRVSFAQSRTNPLTSLNTQVSQSRGQVPTFSMLFSGRKFADYLLPGTPGTEIYDSIRRVPKVGGILAEAADALTSPTTLATIGAGSWVSGAAKAVPLIGRPLSSLVAPAATGSIGRRFAGEAALSLGAVAGSKLGGQIAEDTPLETPARIAGGLAGAGLGLRSLRNTPESIAPAIRETVEDTAEPVIKEGFNLDMLSGGASKGHLLDDYMPKAKLSFTEKVNDGFQAMLNLLDQKGVREHEIGTPLKRGYLSDVARIHSSGAVFSSTGLLAQKLFQVDKNGISQFGKLKGLPIQEIAQHYSKYKSFMTPEQKQTMGHLRAIQDSFTEAWYKALAPHGQVPKLLEITDPEGFYLTRFGTIADDGLIPSIPGRLSKSGGKKSFEDDRKFKSMTQAIAAGFKYPSLSNALERYSNDMATRIADLNLLAELKKLPKYEGRTPGAVDLYGATRLQLDPEIADVLNKVVNKSIKDRNEGLVLYKSANAALKSINASSDASWMGIQTLLTAAANPILATKLAPIAFKTLFNPTIFSKYLQHSDEVAADKGLLSTVQWAGHGLHFSGLASEGLDIAPATGGILKGISRLPVIKQTNQMFSAAGDIFRLGVANAELEKLKSSGRTISTEDLRSISSVINNATGYSEKNFLGDIGGLTLFAPKFLQSQLETTTKALRLNGTELEKNIAGKYMIKLIAAGTALTFGINTARGEDTVFDPTDSNFLRIRNVKGTDISLFGPWDSLIRGIMHTASGDFDYMARSKANPIISTAWDLILGRDIMDQKTRTPEDIARHLLTPFSIRDSQALGGDDPLMSTLVGFLGGKASPLTGSEVLEQTLENAGITKSSPDYEIQKRQYLVDHPEVRPQYSGAEAEYTRDVQERIRAKEDLNERKTLDSEQTLREFRENRTLINTERRLRLEAVVAEFNNKAKTPQQKWIKSYYEIFKDPEVLDPITDKPNNDKIDLALANWRNSNGEGAWDYMQRYLLAGQGEVETQYLSDLQKLQSVGYFDTPKYRNLKSDLSEEELQSLRDQVSAARSTTPRLKQLSFDSAAKQVLRGQDSKIISDVINIGLNSYQNPEHLKLQNLYHKELLWFNPNVTWEYYVNDKGAPEKSIKASRGRTSRSLSRNRG